MTDALCFDDLDLFGREINDPIEELRQDLYHRGLEPPGSNIDDTDRGLGLESATSKPLDRTLGHRIEADFRKDDRVDQVAATVTEIDNGNAGDTVRIDIDVVPGGGLTLEIDDEGVRSVAS